MTPAEETSIVHPEQSLLEILEIFGRDSRRAVVVENGRVVGILSPTDVMRASELERLRQAQPTRRRSAGVVVWVVVGLLMLAAASYLFTPPILALRPGATLDVSDDFTITGIPTDPIDGEYLLTSVQLEQPNGLKAIYLAVTNQAELVPFSSVFPEGVDQGEFVREQQEIFRQSQTLAAAAAAQAAGLDVVVGGDGVRVEEVVPSSPAARVLEPGDVITALDGRPINIAADLQETLTNRPAGTTFALEVQRGEREITVEVSSRRLEQLPEGGVGIGIVITTVGFDVELPFDIEFRDRDVGGPSAGLAYALAITDMLDEEDFAGGQTIGATGTIDAAGEVGPVGGVAEKAVALADIDADLFLVPAQQVDDVTTDDIEVRGVSSLEDALQLLGASGSA